MENVGGVAVLAKSVERKLRRDIIATSALVHLIIALPLLCQFILPKIQSIILIFRVTNGVEMG